MTPFTVLTAPAVVLDRANVDTDQIIPARFLRKPRSAGYGSFLFADLRREQGADFPLAGEAARNAAILVTDANFGCGSSREGAVYALVDAGFRCVVAPSFGDIFAGNSAKNGLLTVALPAAECAALRQEVRDAGPDGTVVADLPAQSIRGPGGRNYGFDIDPFRKRCLVEALDDIGLTLEYGDEIGAWEQGDARRRPWVTPGRIEGVDAQPGCASDGAPRPPSITMQGRSR